MSLRDRLLEKVAAAESEKLANEILVAAFVDELSKLGYDAEMLKRAGLGEALAKVKGIFKFPVAKPAAGAISKKVDYLGAVRKHNLEISRAKAVPAPKMNFQAAKAPAVAPWENLKGNRPYRGR